LISDIIILDIILVVKTNVLKIELRHWSETSGSGSNYFKPRIRTESLSNRL